MQQIITSDPIPLPSVDVSRATAAKGLRPPSPATPVCFDVLGGFVVRAGAEPLELPPSALRVLALLALHERPLQRLYVASTLWIDATEDHANACLRTALWRAQTSAGPLVRARGRLLMLDPSIRVDLWERTPLAKAALSGPLPSTAEIDALCGAADVLPDWYDDWAVTAREQFRQLRLHALERLCERCSADGRFAEAAQLGLAAVAAEPLRESAHRSLIRAHLSEGNVNEALRQYDFFCVLLQRELGLAPTPAMEELIAGALAAT